MPVVQAYLLNSRPAHDARFGGLDWTARVRFVHAWPAVGGYLRRILNDGQRVQSCATEDDCNKQTFDRRLRRQTGSTGVAADLVLLSQFIWE